MTYPYHDKDQDRVTGSRSNIMWKRAAIMFLFMICFSIAQSVLYAVAIIQFIWMIFNEERNIFLAQFGYSLSIWLAETARFLTGDIEEKPFPWKPWPEV